MHVEGGVNKLLCPGGQAGAQLGGGPEVLNRSLYSSKNSSFSRKFEIDMPPQ